jgi:hypothetical protein
MVAFPMLIEMRISKTKMNKLTAINSKMGKICAFEW